MYVLLVAQRPARLSETVRGVSLCVLRRYLFLSAARFGRLRSYVWVTFVGVHFAIKRPPSLIPVYADVIAFLAGQDARHLGQL